MSTLTPRQAVAALQSRPVLPEGSDERFSGYGVLGVPFESGHYLALRDMVANSIGPAYRAIWHRDPAGHWTIHTTVKLPGLAILSPGTELSISGERGRVFRFLRYVETPRGSWIDVYGGTRDPNGERAIRSFTTDRIRQTYRKPQLRRRTES